MRRLQRSGNIRPILSAAAVYFCTGLSITSMLVLMARLGVITLDHWATATMLTSPLMFLCASAVVFFRPARGYALALTAGAAALPWLC